MEELTKEFIAESEEGLDRMERCLTALEARPDDPDLLGEIFRAVHSIKGTTGFLGFARLEALAHAGESLLGLVRDGRVTVTGELINDLLELLDGLRRILRLIEGTGSDGKRADDVDRTLIERLGRPCADSEMHASVRLNPPSGEMKGRQTDRDKDWHEHARGGSERTLRVDVDVLNRMMNLVGELVLTRNQILQSSLDAPGFAQLKQCLNTVTADLRETVTQARLQPVGNVFNKFPRLVRDLAKTCRKKVRIELAGEETGLDKSLLEAIKDPLTHAIRNAVDHGIESTVVRRASGKMEEGVLRLKAFHQGGAVVIELTDDGAGIDVERVRAKAVEQRLVTRERAAALLDTDILQMVFLPGLSTAAAVTNVSGRGVGMDVVRSNVEKAGGSVELETLLGTGTTLRLRVPLTLAIIPALVVVSGAQTFAVPQNAVVELVYIGHDEVRGALQRIGSTELYRLRGHLLPIVRLDRLLGIEGARGVVAYDGIENNGRSFYLAVLEVDGCRFGLMLDELLAPEEIVVKPLSRMLREIGIFSGATVLGSGTLALILDVAAIAARVGVSGLNEEVQKKNAHVEKVSEEAPGKRFLLFQGSRTAQTEMMAIPLEQVVRIERVAVDGVEYAGRRPVLQYLGSPLPLEDPAAVLTSSGPATVVICHRTDAQGSMGLVVAEVSHVAMGSLVPSSRSMFGEQLALVEGKLVAVQEPRAVGCGASHSWEETGEVA